MKRNGIVLLALAALLLTLLALTGAGADTETCRHNWVKVGDAPTCTQNGWEEYQCTKCYATRGYRVISAKGHTWKWKTVKAATCGANGSRQQVCSACGAKGKTETVKATGKHSYEWKTIGKATCGADGSRRQVCKVCGAKGKTETVKATGKHTFGDWKVSKAAACEQAGEESRACSVCKKTETRTVQALGHDWDAGAVTREPGYLNPGETTYTCARCGETRTEEIPVKQLPDSLLNNDSDGDGPAPGGFETIFDPLRITVQPSGGCIDREGGSLLLSVEAAGGTPPYTYKWKTAYNAWWMRLWRDAENGTDSTLEAKEGNHIYYCHVYDNNGGHAVSDIAEVNWNLYIAKQPENRNIKDKDSVTLSCEAAGGVPFGEGYKDPYTYYWFDSEGSGVGYGPSCQVDRPGEYHCAVEDAVQNTVQSATAVVYEADPFEAKTYTPVVELLEGETRQLSALVSGGVAPYTGVWTREGKEIPTQTQENGEYTADILGDGESEVLYTFTARDDMGDDCSVTVKAGYRQLKISRQPVGGPLQEKGFLLVLGMREGETPFTYTISRNGEFYAQYTSESPYTAYSVFEPGEYYFHIKDAENRWADSDTVSVIDPPELTIARYECDEFITNQKDASLTVEVADGEAPYTYSLLNDGVVINHVTSYGSYHTFSIDEPGWYAIRVRDAEDRQAKTKYAGVIEAKLRIVKHPGDATITYVPNVFPSATFTCEAEGFPDHELTYQWEAKSTDGWYKFNPSTKDTFTFKESVSADGSRYYILPQAFRCTVRDTVTGEEITSKEANVIRPGLKVTGGQIGHTTEIRLLVEGGLGPYTITAKRGTGGSKGSETPYDIDTIVQMGGDRRYTWDISIRNVSKHRSKKLDPAGTQMWYNHYTYEFTVWDTLGNKAVIKIYMHSDNEETTTRI